MRKVTKAASRPPETRVRTRSRRPKLPANTTTVQGTPDLRDIAKTLVQLPTGGFGNGNEEAIITARRMEIVTFLTAGMSSSEIVRQMERNGVGEKHTRNMLSEVRKKWKTDYEEDSKYSRAETIHRLRRDLVKMRADNSPNWNNIRGHERLLAQVEGTLAPIKVSMTGAPSETIAAAATSVIGNWDPRKLKAFVTEGVDVTPVAAE